MNTKKLDEYYQNNYLFRSHTMMMPEMTEKNTHTCRDCIYFATIIGRYENKTCCVQPIPMYRNKTKKPPKEVSIYQLLKYLSVEQLINLIKTTSIHKTACGSFVKRI
jgi:hypothetical protein